ncbi:hypothetical protein ADICYQ_1712 [Cyclobacterium qasimii M12-11B]|uniref:Uncharacterized protein n=1 Tax=Cyclobacterium qasimii M12-11B TaxID=641524 RepID=S7VI87_9BACT|nr:hypothetical protein ADICYQ_1712 [Cyclobacterium qasimii M12-11B]
MLSIFSSNALEKLACANRLSENSNEEIIRIEKKLKALI